MLTPLISMIEQKELCGREEKRKLCIDLEEEKTEYNVSQIQCPFYSV